MTADAVKQQRLRLIDNGWRPIPLRSWRDENLAEGEHDRNLGKAPAISAWQRCSATADDLDGAMWLRSTSTGIVCGPQRDGSHLLAVDIDILDAALSIEVAEKTAELLGPSPLLRIGRDPKRLLVYRVKYPFAKLQYAEGLVELLSNGKQFVAFGLHPDTGRPYTWPNGDSPENTALEDVPATTADKVDALVEWLDQRLAPRDGSGSGRGATGPRAAWAPERNEDGLVSAGREQLLMRIVFREFNNLAAPSLDELVTRSWAEFTRQAVVSDGRWKQRDVAVKARYLLNRWRRGDVQHNYVGATHTALRPTVTLAEAKERADAAVERFYETEVKPWIAADDKRRRQIDQHIEAARKAAESEFEFSDDSYKKSGIRMRVRLAREEAEQLYPFVEPPVGYMQTTTGEGKSRRMRRLLAKAMADHPKRGVETIVPEHRLSKEQAADFTKQTGLPARVHLGLKQVDPAHTDGRTMCTQPELSDAAVKAHVPMADVCKRCPDFGKCGSTVQTLDPPLVWIEASAMLYRPRPKHIPRPVLQFIDERFDDGALGGYVELAASTFTLPSLDDVKGDDRDELFAAYDKAAAAIAKAVALAGDAKIVRMPIGDALVAAGMDKETAGKARAAEWRRKEKPTLSGSPADMVAELNGIARRFNSRLPLFWSLVEEALDSGEDVAVGIEVEPRATLADGEGTGTKLRLYRRNVIHDDRKLPTIISDGTGSLDLIRELFPQAKLLVDLEVEAPHMRWFRVHEPFTKKRLVPDAKATAAQNAARRSKLADVSRCLEVIGATHWPRRVLVACNGEKNRDAVTVETLLKAGGLPRNMVIRHFGTLRGVNEFEDVGAIVMVGATRPLLAETRRNAERLARRPLELDDPLVAALSWSTTEAELLQVAGRGRGIRRTAANPLTVYQFSDIVLPVPYARVLSWQEAKPTAAELLKARGITMDCPTGARGYWPLVAALLPDLYPSADAARMDAARLSREQTSMDSIYIEECSRESGWLPYTAKAKAAGEQAAGRYAVPVLADPARLPELAAVLDMVPRQPDPPPPPIKAALNVTLDGATLSASATVHPAPETPPAARKTGLAATPLPPVPVQPIHLGDATRSRWRPG